MIISAQMCISLGTENINEFNHFEKKKMLHNHCPVYTITFCFNLEVWGGGGGGGENAPA